ncbi:MAG TPA: Ig-like domain-containing protein [Candidatus Binatia bacterium]|nr:Ig-like domain-containing protein [Candidatus Binatia bacterium]
MNLNSCMETFQTTALGIGTHQVTAAYESGNPYLASSTSHELTQVVDGYATSTTLTSTLNPSVYGQSVTWTATVTTSGPNPPTGSINFKWTLNGQTFSIGAATLNANGVATLARSNLDADLYPITAVYPGDANNAGSDSPVLNQTIQPATSTAALTSTPNPSTVGQAVIFTATISSPTVRPTGPVTFAAGKSTLGTGQLSKGKATLTTSSLAAGSTMVTATFNGDSNIAASSASVVQAVTSSSGNSTTTTITSSANPASFGEKVAFTAQVSSGAGTPPNGEIVTFSSGSTVLGPGVLSGGLATLMTSLLPGGINSITASYPGDATYLASTSAPLSQQIQTTATSAIVTWVASAPQNEILTATVAGPNGTPTGSVTFTVGNTVLGTSQLANGVATLTVATLAVGSNTITATYNGDQNNAPTSAWTTQTFVMPYNATMYLQQEGGSAAGTTEFGIGTWPTNFVQDYSGLPNDPNPTGQVLVGSFDAGTIVNVGMYTTFGSQVGWAFSDEVGTNQAALISFADLSNELGLNHSITQQTSSSTWLLWLDDAVSYLYDDDNNDVMMEIILVAN